MIIITFIVICFFSILVVLLSLSSSSTTQNKPISTTIDSIANCKQLYMRFILAIKNRDFKDLSSFCLEKLLQEIKYIHNNIAIPLHINFTKMTDVITINSREKIISIDFYCNSIDKIIKDTCEFYVKDNRMFLQRFNNLGKNI